MLKMALFDCAINDKCCSVDEGRGRCPLFSSPSRGFDSSRIPTPGNLLPKAKKNANARVSVRWWGWTQVELTDVLFLRV